MSSKMFRFVFNLNALEIARKIPFRAVDPLGELHGIEPYAGLSRLGLSYRSSFERLNSSFAEEDFISELQMKKRKRNIFDTHSTAQTRSKHCL